MSVQTLQLSGESLTLLPEGAVHWPARQTLVVADLHLGKAGVFRRAGLAVPEGDTRETLARLDQLLDRYAIQRLILLGDVLHASPRNDPGLIAGIAAWREHHVDCAMTAVIGNHDREIGPLAELLDWQVEGQTEGGLSLRHHPPESTDHQPWLAGHWHPVVRLSGGGDRLRLPAFVLEDDTGLVLPAFGGLTGGLPIYRMAGRQRFACAGDRVVNLDGQPLRDRI